MKIQGKHYRTVWMEGNVIKLINQPLIPHKFEIYDCHNLKQTAEAIKTMIVRGAGAIGATGAFGLAQAVLNFKGDFKNFFTYIGECKDILASTRPTAYDLFHGLDFVFNAFKDCTDFESAKEKAVSAANQYADIGAESCKKIGEHGAKLIADGNTVLTHCNAGWLAFVDYGSALSPVFVAHNNKKKIFVFADETRPRCQGARLTAFELAEEEIPHAIIADNASGHYMKAGKVDIVITGADRIAVNGDAANKIGTYEKAVLAKENGIPFYIAAPTSTIDRNCKSGDKIPIEERNQDEVLYMFGWDDKGEFSRVRIAPKNSCAKNPAFDVTPAKYISGIITEKGIVEASEEGIRKLFE